MFHASSGAESASLQTMFDAECQTPELVDQISKEVPQIREIMSSLRNALPLAPHCGVGPVSESGFYRIPNHYRSVSYMLRHGDPAEGRSTPGVIVFKGTEPLLPDFPAYLDWMLRTPFRASSLPLGLHFPLDMKLPPAAMWIEECIAEQAVASRIQQLYLRRHGHLARLPLPLFVFKLTPQQNGRYEEIVKERIPPDALRKIKNKLADGMGVEVYYYPELPVRVADLFVGNVRGAFRQALTGDRVEVIVGDWTRLLAEILCLDYMPYAPWHHGMGGCVDKGNACIDGGFNDLLTLIPFDSIPDDLFDSSLQASTRMLAETVVLMATASISTSAPPVADSDAVQLALSYLTRNLREQVIESDRNGYQVDSRLKRFLDPAKFTDLLQLLYTAQRSRSAKTQFVSADTSTVPRKEESFRVALGALGG
jgi:hypothetical protein